MKLVLISDTHGKHRQFDVPEGEVLIHAGDFMCDGRDVRDAINFDVWLGSLPHKYKIVIAGNHDILFETNRNFAKSLLTNAIYLENSGTEIGGFNFWGSPVQPEFNDWAFNVKRGRDIKKYWDMVPINTDVLITHGPPYGVLDQSRPDQQHLGCEELLKAVNRVMPMLHVFGHIHGGYGERDRNITKFVNSSLLNEAYQPVNKPIVVELSE